MKHHIPGRIFDIKSAVPPAVEHCAFAQLLHSNDLTHRNELTYYYFDQPAPECSRHFLFQTALSVGDAVFLSTSENGSLFLHICFSYYGYRY